MLRISETRTTKTLLTLSLEGRMTGPWIQEVRLFCQQFMSNGRRLKLDLQKLSFVDRQGVCLLRKLERHGVVLTNYSAFIAERLKEVAQCEE